MKSLFDTLPPELLPDAEARERAVAKWENEIRPTMADPVQRPGWLPPEAIQQRALARLEELRAAADEPIVIGEALQVVLDRWKAPGGLMLESRTPTDIEVEREERRYGMG